MEKTKTYFASNLKFLRNRRSLLQESLAVVPEIPVSRLAAFENIKGPEPSMEDLVAISNYFKISVDLILKEDLSRFSEAKLMDLETSMEYIKGQSLRIMAVTVDSKGRENIEYVPLKVKAGYLAGYNDPDFIKDLPKASLPFVSGGRSLRIFECEGDSMLPLPEKCRVLGEYVEDWHDIRDGEIYIVISYKEGFAIKVLRKRLDNNSITLQSLNPLYPEYEMYLRDVNEIWKFRMLLSEKFPEYILPSEKEKKADAVGIITYSHPE